MVVSSLPSSQTSTTLTHFNQQNAFLNFPILSPHLTDPLPSLLVSNPYQGLPPSSWQAKPRRSVYVYTSSRISADTWLICHLTCLPDPRCCQSPACFNILARLPLNQLAKEYVAMQKEPPPFIWAVPDEKNILTCTSFFNILS